MNDITNNNTKKSNSFLGSLLSLVTPAKKLDRISPPTEAELRVWLSKRISEVTELPLVKIDPNTPFADFGIDSRAAVSMAGDLEKMLGKNLSPTLIWDYPTINEVASHLATLSSNDSTNA